MGVGSALRRIVTASEWNIGVADLKLEDLVGHCQGVGDEQVVGHGQAAGAPTVTPRVRWLPKPWYVRVQADPCLVQHDGRFFVYFEDLLAGSTKGRLRVAELRADGTLARSSAPMMNLPHHAAYPYVFSHLDTYYCVPETGPVNRVILFSASSPAGPWTLHSTLLEGVSTRDNNICRFADRWWLFCTVADADPRSQQANLHIWHAPEPWGPWEPHRLQPAKVDIHSARPAGSPFTIDGVLYRPAQDSSLRYGGRTVINRVLTLTPDDFAEEVRSSVEPDPQGHYSEGLHTLASADGLVIVDGCHEGPTANPFKIATAAVPKVRQRLGRVTRNH